MSEATILKLAEHIVAGVMMVGFFGFLSFVFWLRHVSDQRDLMKSEMEEWKREHGFDRRPDKRRA